MPSEPTTLERGAHDAFQAQLRAGGLDPDAPSARAVLDAHRFHETDGGLVLVDRASGAKVDLPEGVEPVAFLVAEVARRDERDRAGSAGRPSKATYDAARERGVKAREDAKGRPDWREAVGG